MNEKVSSSICTWLAVAVSNIFQLPGGWGRCPQAGATGSLEGYDLWLEVPLELYHTSIPTSKHDAKTFKIVGWSGESSFSLIFLGSQFNERFYLFPSNCALIVGTKKSRKVIITRQLGKASTTEPIGQPLVVSNIKPERYQDLIRNLFQGHAAGSREFLLLSSLFILIYFVFYFIGNSILKDGQENEFQSALNERKELSSKICLTIKLSNEKRAKDPGCLWLFKGIF